MIRSGWWLAAILPGVLFFLLSRSEAQDTERVGPVKDGTLVPTGQLIRPAGHIVSWQGRPVDLVLSGNGKRLYVKDNTGLLVLDTVAWKILQRLAFPARAGGSMQGLALTRDGRRLYATTAHNLLLEADVGSDGLLKWGRKILLPGPGGKGPVQATGIALGKDGKRAWVCLSRNNSLGVVDLTAGKLLDEIPVGVAPYAVLLSGNEETAWVSNWGGRRPKAGERTALSSDTPTLVDSNGVASSGTVARVDLKQGKMLAEIETGLHPAGMVRSADGRTLYVANANSDTVSILTTQKLRLLQSLLVRPEPALPFGSGTNAVALGRDGRTLYAANGGNNAVAVIGLGGAGARQAVLRGFIPAGWYPGAVVCDDKYLYIANVKGEGSRTPGKSPGWGVYGYKGTLSRVALPNAKELENYTRQVRADARIPQVLRAMEKGDASVKPAPVPARAGEPSVFEHVVYVIKENRTYDQVFGDLKQGNGDAKLCIFGRDVTPNHHALAEQFVLLDNFYCNGVLSADGHSWATEGNVTDHLEKSFGGFTRSYTFGDDPLTYSATGFIWDGVLLAGRSFRNYGEMRDTEIVPKNATFADVWKDYRSGKKTIKLKHKMGIDTLSRYSAPDSPGWNMNISDQQRLDVFLKEFRENEKKGVWQDFTIVYLPQDHTSGTTPGMPTPQAHVADNDLALGRLVEAISKSRFWKKTCIFVIEDDPQNGFDHVDGHRSPCLVISPYTKRKQVVSRFYNQTSVVHTMDRILGLPAKTQFEAMAPLMTDCFTSRPDFTPYKALPVKVPLDQLNKPLKELKGAARRWAEKSLAQDLSQPDAIDDDTFNRILWHAVKGTDAPYPSAWAGAHGRGLKALGLRKEARVKR
jgi:DNA-binding beta-propeller fold protein YncE